MVCLNLLPVAFEKSYRLRQASCFIIKECNLCKKIPELCALCTKSNADFLHFDGEVHAKKP